MEYRDNLIWNVCLFQIHLFSLVMIAACKMDLSLEFVNTAGQVWDVSTPRQEVVVGGATLALFTGKLKQLKTGKQKLRLWRGRQADGSVPTKTPGKVLFMTN